MNPKYYVSPEEANRVIAFLNKHSVGGGVKNVYPNVFTGPFSIPASPGKEMLQVVLNNGVDMNAGMTLDLMNKGYPEFMVAATLKANADMMAPKQD